MEAAKHSEKNKNTFNVKSIKSETKDRQSQIVGKTVNKVGKRKSTLRTKLKVASQKENMKGERTFQQSAWRLPYSH